MARLRAVPESPRRALGYVRVSMAREEMISPELQRAAITTYCEQHGYLLVDIIEELDVSGRNFARAGVQEAIERVERREAEVIVVWKVSRFGRTRRDWYVHADRVEVVGGSLESATEAFDPRTSTGRLTRGMLVELAAWESDVKSEQWKEAHEHRFAQGKTHAGGPRFGYVYDRDVQLHVPDPETGPILAECYTRYVAGQTPGQIVAWLNGLGVRTAIGNRWEAGALRQVLGKGFGAGYLWRRKHGELIRGAHEPVISEDLWRAYLRRKGEARQEAPRARGGPHPLTGLVVCATCDKTMNTWRGNQGGRTYTAYKCYRGCRKNYVSTDTLHQAVKDKLAEIGTEDLDARANTLAQQKAKRAIARGDLKQVEKQLVDAHRALVRLSEGWAKGFVPDDAYEAAREGLAQEQQALEARATELATEAAHLTGRPRALARSILSTYDVLLERDPTGLREVLHHLIREIRVEPGKAERKATVTPLWE